MDKNPIQQRRESLEVERSELARRADISVDELALVEEGAHIVLSLPLATKLSQALQGSKPQELVDEYRRWKQRATDEAA